MKTLWCTRLPYLALTGVLLLGLAASVYAADGTDERMRKGRWIPGWDWCSGTFPPGNPACATLFDEELNYSTSQVTWIHPHGTSTLHIIYTLKGATPNRQYQVGIHVFDQSYPTFGQFPTLTGFNEITRQGVTRALQAFELGVVTTDRFGDGVFGVTVRNIERGTYKLEFTVRTSVGCGFPEGGACDVIFQSPGPFGHTITLVIP